MPRSSFYQEEKYPSPLHQTWSEFKQNHTAMIGLVLLALSAFIVIFAPIISPSSAYEQDPYALLLPPAWHPNGGIDHLFGTDDLGRDLLSRVMIGSQLTIGISTLLVLVTMFFGVLIGAYAGISEGARSAVINHTLDALMAIPNLLIAIIVVAILGTGLSNGMWAIGLALLPQFIHQSRDLVRREFKKDYVLAARLDGASNVRIFIYQVLPNLVEGMVVQATFALSMAILDISALGFLKLAAQSPSPELGAMLSEGLDIAYISPWSIALPGLAIFVTIISINLVGDGLRSALRSRLKH